MALVKKSIDRIYEGDEFNFDDYKGCVGEVGDCYIDIYKMEEPTPKELLKEAKLSLMSIVSGLQFELKNRVASRKATDEEEIYYLNLLKYVIPSKKEDIDDAILEFKKKRESLEKAWRR